MFILGGWALLVAVLECLFGVLKSKGGRGLGFVFGICLVMEISLASLGAYALFDGDGGLNSLRDTFQLTGNTLVHHVIATLIAIIIDGFCLFTEAAMVGFKLRETETFLGGVKRSILIATGLTVAMVAPAIPLGVAGFMSYSTDRSRSNCDEGPANVLLTYLIASAPLIGGAVGGVLVLFLYEMRVSRMYWNYALFGASYLCYAGIVLARGVALLTGGNNPCAKHSLLLVSNLVPAVVTLSSAFFLEPSY